MPLHRRLPFLALVFLTLPGCLCMMLANTQATDEELKPYYFTYAGRDPYADTSQALVTGQILAAGGLNGGGTCFRILRATPDGGWAPVTHTVEYKTSSYHGIILGRWWHDKKKEAVDVYAGNAPMGRREPFADIIDTGGMAASLVMGDSDWSRNVTALQTWIPVGWFLVRLPPGRYRIGAIAHHTNRTDTKSGYSSTTVTSTDWILDRDDGPQFTVEAGRVNFIGSYAYGTSGAPAVKRDVNQAGAVVAQAVSRLAPKSPAWPIVETTTDLSPLR